MKNWLSDLKLPTDLGKEIANIPKEVAKEVAKAMLSQTEKIKDEAMALITKEVDKFVSQLDIAEEIKKVMKESVVEINVQFRLKEDKPSLEQQIHVTPVSTKPKQEEDSLASESK